MFDNLSWKWKQISCSAMFSQSASKQSVFFLSLSRISQSLCGFCFSFRVVFFLSGAFFSLDLNKQRMVLRVLDAANRSSVSSFKCFQAINNVQAFYCEMQTLHSVFCCCCCRSRVDWLRLTVFSLVDAILFLRSIYIATLNLHVESQRSTCALLSVRSFSPRSLVESFIDPMTLHSVNKNCDIQSLPTAY